MTNREEVKKELKRDAQTLRKVMENPCAYIGRVSFSKENRSLKGEKSVRMAHFSSRLIKHKIKNVLVKGTNTSENQTNKTQSAPKEHNVKTQSNKLMLSQIMVQRGNAK